MCSTPSYAGVTVHLALNDTDLNLTFSSKTEALQQRMKTRVHNVVCIQERGNSIKNVQLIDLIFVQKFQHLTVSESDVRK